MILFLNIFLLRHNSEHPFFSFVLQLFWCDTWVDAFCAWKQHPESRLIVSVSRHTLKTCRTVMVLAVSQNTDVFEYSQLVSRHALDSDISYCTLIFLACLHQTYSGFLHYYTHFLSLIGSMFYCEMWPLLNCLYVFNPAGSSSTCWILTVTPHSNFQLVFKHARFFPTDTGFLQWHHTQIFSLQSHMLHSYNTH